MTIEKTYKLNKITANVKKKVSRARNKISIQNKGVKNFQPEYS
jgi:hypothetical protein